MPTYDYECKNCGTFEVFQSMSDEAMKTCPECQTEIKRLIGGGSGVIFKGSGFYVTDTKSAKKNSTTSSVKNDVSASSNKSPAEKKPTEKKASA